MRIKKKHFIILTVILFLTACNDSREGVQALEETSLINEVTDSLPLESESIQNAFIDLHKAFLEYDLKLRESLKNYDSEKSEYAAKKEDIFGRSTEGGHIVRQYKDDMFVGYTSVFFGETGKIQYNYYEFDDFIYLLEISEKYNVPFYFTAEKVAEEKLNMEPFDPQKSTISTREYIKDGAYLYEIHREKQEMILVLDNEEINSFNICQQDVSVKPAERPLSESLHSPSFSKYNVFAINSLLLGGCFNNKWVNDEELFSMIGQTEDFKIYLNGSYQGVETGTKVPSTTDPMFSGNSIFFEHSQYDGINDVFYFSGDADLDMKFGEKLSADSEVYKNALTEYMRAEGYKGEIVLESIIKFDIDKDGMDEVFISGTNLWDADAPEYADRILYMRKIVEDKVENIPFPIDDPIVPSDMKTIMGFCDLNGDGVDEIVVKIRGIGYGGFAVFETKENRIVRIFANGHEH